MITTLSVRLPEDLAEWVDVPSRRTGRSRASLVKEALERLKNEADRPYMKLAGSVDGQADLSVRKGLSKA